MKGKFMFVVGLGVGYVLGTRAGRERYEQIRKAAQDVWNQPKVQEGVDTVKAFAVSRAGDVGETVLDGAKKLVSQFTSTQGTSTRSTAAKSATTSGSAGATTSRTTTGSSTGTGRTGASKSSGNGTSGSSGSSSKSTGAGTGSSSSS